MTEKLQQEEKSRSRVKREFREVKELGIHLAGLSKGQLSTLPLSEEMRDALLATKEMTRTALQRQYRHLASLLAEEDLAAIRAALTGKLPPHAGKVTALSAAERWREKLLSGDDGQLAAFVERYPQCDRAHLRRLVRNAGRKGEADKPPESARQLLRYLGQLL